MIIWAICEAMCRVLRISAAAKAGHARILGVIEMREKAKTPIGLPHLKYYVTKIQAQPVPRDRVTA